MMTVGRKVRNWMKVNRLRLLLLTITCVGALFLISSHGDTTRRYLHTFTLHQDNPSIDTEPDATTTTTTRTCQKRLAFSKTPLPVTALASVQGSGNTWIRHLLQQLTGIYTGSVYPRNGDPELWAKGYYGEGVSNGSVVAVKTHETPLKKRGFRRAIIVVRNPFDALFADFNRRATGRHTGVAPARAYVKYWNNFTREYMERWTQFHKAWLNFTGPVLFLNFDDMKNDLEPQVKKIAEFITKNAPSVNPDQRCALSASRGSAKRSQADMAVDKTDLYTREQVQLVNSSLRQLQEMLRRAKYTRLADRLSDWLRDTQDMQPQQFRPIPRIL